MKRQLCLDRNAGDYSGRSARGLTGFALLLGLVFALPGCSAAHRAHTDLKSEHSHSESATMASAEPEAQDWAKQRLAKSPRHQEWVKVKYKPAGGGAEREVNAFVVYPEVKNKATAVLVIHEIFGMSDWVQSLTDQLAEAGYIAIAPDLLSGKGPNGGGTSDLGIDRRERSRHCYSRPPSESNHC